MRKRNYIYSKIKPKSGEIILDFHRKRIFQMDEIQSKQPLFWRPNSMIVANAREEDVFRKKCLKNGIQNIGFKEFKEIMPEFNGGYSSMNERYYGYVQLDQVMYLLLKYNAKKNESLQNTLLRLIDDVDNYKFRIECFEKINLELQEKLSLKKDSPQQRIGEYVASILIEMQNLNNKQNG